jgi:hypothetical protein
VSDLVGIRRVYVLDELGVGFLYLDTDYRLVVVL